MCRCVQLYTHVYVHVHLYIYIYVCTCVWLITGLVYRTLLHHCKLSGKKFLRIVKVLSPTMSLFVTLEHQDWPSNVSKKCLNGILLYLKLVHILSTSFIPVYVRKTDHVVTVGLFHFIGPASSYTHTLPIHSAIIRLNWLVCFSRASFSDHVNSRRRQ